MSVRGDAPLKPATPHMAAAEADQERRRWFLYLLAMLVVLYALLQNGRWTPGNDSEFYLVTARNLLAGRGYVFNGAPFGHYPPGWPLFLAGLMLVSRSFWFLNGVAAALLVGAALLYYFVMLRFASPRRAFACVALSATLWFWFRYSYTLYSESLFTFLLVAALLVALQIREGARLAWRIPALLLLCAMMALTRWVGVIACGAVGLTVVSGSLRPRWNARWLACAATAMVGVAVFVTTYFWTQRRGSGGGASQGEVVWLEVDGTGYGAKSPSPTDPRVVLRRKVLRLRSVPLVREIGPGGYGAKVVFGGIWLSQMLWPVALVGAKSTIVLHAFNLVGWCLWIPWILHAAGRTKRRDWMWCGIAVYVIFFVATRSAKGRYIAPFAPLLILGILAGSEEFSGWLASHSLVRLTGAVKWFERAFLIALVVSNGIVFAIAAWVQRSANYYGRFRAGQFDELVRAAFVISREGPPDGKVVVDLRRNELSGETPSRQGLSAMVLLTDRPVISMVSDGGKEWVPSSQFLRWAEGRGVRYFLYRPPTSPWRLWHFRVPWLQRALTGKKDIPVNPSWVLYRIEGDNVERVTLPPVRDWPLEVPPVGGAIATVSTVVPDGASQD